MFDILPPPFDWCEIPAGKVTLTGGGYVPTGGQTFDVPAFSIAKYPVTNAQFAKFIEFGGYRQETWWTVDGWATREEEKWTEPNYWRDSDWNGTEQPVVGVSWYETIPFCWWLSEVSGEKIRLPTELQWQRAAQTLPSGHDSGYAYPWGNDWDASKCNNGVDDKGLGKTTPVRQYEGRGDSPCGVVDLVGNVFEWCRTNHGSGKDDVHTNHFTRILRGGSWYNSHTKRFRADYRAWDFPYRRNCYWGFRVVRL